MFRIIVLSALVALTLADHGPIRECREGDMYIADVEDLCRYWWCVENHGVKDFLCAPGSRVPTWWESSADYHNPCVMDNRDEPSCLRCDLGDDPRLPDDADDCAVDPCGSGCTCQDLYRAFYCLCPDTVLPAIITVDPEGQYCDTNQCINGGTCYSQWDDYWCFCPNGFTGKNCENDYCSPNPCRNGGTCVRDETNYHCNCPPGTTGPCCDGGRPVTNPVVITPPTTLAPIDCDACHYGAQCENLVTQTCECNPCPNYDDNCFNGVDDGDRYCESNPDLSGTPFTLLFMQNRPDDTEDRELEIYITAAGAGSRRVRIYSPYADPSSPCYFSDEITVSGFSVERYVVPKPECYEHQGSRVFNDKVVKVESVDSSDLLVYCVNRDQWSADAWIAFPDGRAKSEFYVMTYGPPFYSTEFAFLALEDDTTVNLGYQPGASPDLQQNTFTLNAGQSVQIQSEGDLTGTHITSNKPIHAYSGNIRALITQVLYAGTPNITSGSRDHLVEQLIPVNAWGREYHIVPIPDRIFGDHIRILASEDGTVVTVERNDPDEVTSKQVFPLSAGKFAVFDAFSGNSYRITSNNKISVAQFTKSKDATEASNDPSLILVPAVKQFANRYMFSTPEYSGGLGAKRPYNTSFALISAKSEDRDGIMVRNKNTGNTFMVSDQSKFGEWKQIPGTDYYGKAVQIEFGTNFIEHADQNVAFMSIFYGMDDRESLGFPNGMMLYDIE